MNGKGKRGKTQTSFSQSVGESAVSRRAHVCNRKSSSNGIASSVGHTASSKSLLSSARPSPKLASMARTASSCWQQRRELGATRIALDAPLLRRKAHLRAHGTVDAEQCRASLHVRVCRATGP